MVVAPAAVAVAVGILLRPLDDAKRGIAASRAKRQRLRRQR
jgi:hypothetical protein